MVQLMMRELYVSRLYILITLLIVPFFYVINSPSILGFFFAVFFVIFITFHADENNKVNRFLVSLPVNRNNIVAGRYLFSIFSLLLLIIFYFIVDLLARNWLPYLDLDYEPWTGFAIILFITGFSVALSIFIPLYYYFDTFKRAISVQIVLFFVGILGSVIISGNPNIISVILYFVAIQPYVIPLFFSCVCLYGSYRLSAWLFAKRDL